MRALQDSGQRRALPDSGKRRALPDSGKKMMTPEKSGRGESEEMLQVSKGDLFIKGILFCVSLSHSEMSL